MKVTVVGSGYVGLVSGACLASLGHEVCCVDRVAERVAQIARGEAPFHEPGLPELLRETLASGRLTASTGLADAVAASELTIIAVGTPPRGDAPDLSFLDAAAAEIGRALAASPAYHVVVVKSTVPPGTTAAVGERIAAASRRPADGFGLCMNPEFLREGHAVSDFLHPDRIVIGERDPRSGAAVASLYEAFDCPTLRTSLENAELIKYTSNGLLSVLISFSNEIAAICESVPGTDVETVMAGLHLDRRLSPIADGRRVRPGVLEYLRAGIGFGGSCLPKDVNALRTFGRGRQLETPMLDATMRINTRRPGQIVDRVEQVLGGLAGRTVAVLGLAFKPGTDDLRDSPAIPIVRALAGRGAAVRAFDPISLEAARRSLHDVAGLELCASPESVLDQADAAVVATAWPEFTGWDWTALTARMRRPVIVDGRNALRDVRLPPGTIYEPIGRAVAAPAPAPGSALTGTPAS